MNRQQRRQQQRKGNGSAPPRPPSGLGETPPRKLADCEALARLALAWYDGAMANPDIATLDDRTRLKGVLFLVAFKLTQTVGSDLAGLVRDRAGEMAAANSPEWREACASALHTFMQHWLDEGMNEIAPDKGALTHYLDDTP
jgi:hypothetical protein